MENVRLSFIIPTYNCESFLDETVASVLRQLPDDCELILVDDGSSDATATLLPAYGERGENVVVSLWEHRGVSGARNAGLELARGEFVAFMDCDDMLKEGFFAESMPMLSDEFDLYSFSFDRVEADGEVIPMTVADRRFESASAYADTYVRGTKMLLYSACNKIYRKSILDRYHIRFQEGLSFGEDRVFNYAYLRTCGAIRTSSVKMFDYLQQNPDSASRRTFPRYLETIMMLHEALVSCFDALAEGCTDAEKAAFAGENLAVEIRRMLERFDMHPEEKDELLPKIEGLLAGEDAGAADWYADPIRRQKALDGIARRRAQQFLEAKKRSE